MSERPWKAGVLSIGDFFFRVLIVFVGLFLLADFVMNRIENMPTEKERCAKKVAEELLDWNGSPAEFLEASKRAEARALVICSGNSNG